MYRHPNTPENANGKISFLIEFEFLILNYSPCSPRPIRIHQRRQNRILLLGRILRRQPTRINGYRYVLLLDPNQIVPDLMHNPFNLNFPSNIDLIGSCFHLIAAIWEQSTVQIRLGELGFDRFTVDQFKRMRIEEIMDDGRVFLKMNVPLNDVQPRYVNVL